MTGNGSATGGQHPAAVFATTHWTLVLEAQGESPAAHEALEKLCRIYWRPVYSFVRRNGIPEQEAEDLTQGFFALLLECRDFSAVRREKGRLRSYLLTALKHYITDEHRRAAAIKRGKGERLIALEELTAEDGSGVEPADPVTAEMIYERRWASTVLECVLNLLKEEYAAARNDVGSISRLAKRRNLHQPSR
jgi:RNA polymerase sigma-70 factor (ECF subfamily)